MPGTRGRGKWINIVVAGLVALSLAACGDDDDDTDTAATTTTASATGPNTLDVEMVDYAYKTKGAPRSGLVTVNSSNAGTEWHMAGFGLLKRGKTVAQLVAALREQGGPGAGEGEEGEQDRDPTAEFIDKELGAPGHVLQPGQSQSLTVNLEPGNYVMLCFLPTEGEGTPHLAKGMVAGFEVARAEAAAEEPEAVAEVTLADDAEPTGIPTSLQSGKHTFKLTATGTKGKDFGVGQLKPGQPSDPTTFDRYFETEFEKEGGPAKGAATRAPGTLFGTTFEIEPDQSVWMTVELKPGPTFFVNTTNTEGEGGEEESQDKFVTVNVT